MGVDPLWEKYPNVSGFAYTLNNPVRFIDPDGRAVFLAFILPPLIKAVKAGGAVAVTSKAAGAAASVAATGMIIYSPNAIDNLNRHDPRQGESWQRQQDARVEAGVEQFKIGVQKTARDNIGGPSPDGGNHPKRGGSTLGTVAVGTAVGIHIHETVTTNQDNKNNSQNNATPTITEFTPLVPPQPAPAPADNTRVQLPILIPIPIIE